MKAFSVSFVHKFHPNSSPFENIWPKSLREKAKDMLKFLYRVNDERTREMFDIMVANDKNNKQIREKIVNELIDDFDRIDGKPTKKVNLKNLIND